MSDKTARTSSSKLETYVRSIYDGRQASGVVAAWISGYLLIMSRANSVSW